MKLVKSLKCAVKGIIYTIKNERNMRIHTVIAFYVMLASCFFHLSVVKYAILMLTIGGVMSLEMLNTSVEAIIDICAKEYNSVARVAKDIAAGAVMIFSAVAAAVGFVLFSDMYAYIGMWAYFRCHKILLILLIGSIFISVIYIRSGPAEIKNRLISIVKTVKRRVYRLVGSKKMGRKG